MMRVLLDTDVILDLVLARQPFLVEAKQIFTSIAKNEFEAFALNITIIHVYYFGRKQLGRDATLIELEKLLNLVSICSANASILHKAISSSIKDYEDAVQHECAVAENLDAIITRNTKDYKNSTIDVFSPDDFLQHLQTT